ncbi:pol polyprotein-like protein, partial [Dinothrombium tinctorium]
FYALYWAITKEFKQYLYGRKFIVYTDSKSAVYFKNSKNINPRIIRMVSELEIFDFEVKHKSGKQNCDADMLSRVKHNAVKKSYLIINGIGQLLTVSQPFERVQVDIMGPFKETSRGNKYIVSAIDQLAKYLEMRPISKQDAYNIGKFINEDMNRHGPPLYLMSDKGKVFISDVVQAIVAINPPCLQQLTSGYHPRSNGTVERVQGTLKNVLKTYCYIDDDDWDLYVPSAKYAYNTKVSETTGFSPFELIYNRLPYNQLDIENEPEIHLHENPFGEKAKQRWKKQLQSAKERMQKRQMNSMQRFNENHRQQIFLIRDAVKLRNRHIDIERSSKLQSVYEGPYLVIKRNTNSVYTIQSLSDPEIRHKVN